MTEAAFWVEGAQTSSVVAAASTNDWKAGQGMAFKTLSSKRRIYVPYHPELPGTFSTKLLLDCETNVDDHQNVWIGYGMRNVGDHFTVRAANG